MNNRMRNQGNVPSAGEIAEAVTGILEGSSYTTGAAALVTVLARWIAEQSPRSQADALVWAAALETLVEEITQREKERRNRSRVAA